MSQLHKVKTGNLDELPRHNTWGSTDKTYGETLRRLQLLGDQRRETTERKRKDGRWIERNTKAGTPRDSKHIPPKPKMRGLPKK